MSLLRSIRNKISNASLIFVGGSIVIVAILFPRLFGANRRNAASVLDAPIASADTPASCGGSGSSGDCLSSGDSGSGGDSGGGDGGDSGGSSGG